MSSWVEVQKVYYKSRRVAVVFDFGVLGFEMTWIGIQDFGQRLAV